MNMAVIGGILAGALFLSGCQTTKPQVIIEYREINIPERYLQCDELAASNFPNPDTLTDKQASDLLKKLFARVKYCASNMDAVKNYQKLIAEAKNKTQDQVVKP